MSRFHAGDAFMSKHVGANADQPEGANDAH